MKDLSNLMNELDQSADDYVIVEADLENRASGEAIPEDEPVFVFRARDALALSALVAYHKSCIEESVDAVHSDVVLCRIAHFTEFAVEHPERLKNPDTDKSVLVSMG